MTIKTEIENLSKKLHSQRDEIELKLHLAGMDVKDEWEKTEGKWSDFKGKVEDISDDAKETTEELLEGAQVIGDELKSAYQKIVSRLSE